MPRRALSLKNTTPGVRCTAVWRLAKVQPCPNYMLKVEFIDGTNGCVKMSELIMGNIV